MGHTYIRDERCAGSGYSSSLILRVQIHTEQGLEGVLQDAEHTRVHQLFGPLQTERPKGLYQHVHHRVISENYQGSSNHYKRVSIFVYSRSSGVIQGYLGLFRTIKVTR